MGEEAGMTSRVRLLPDLRERLIQHAQSSPREEICGLLGGKDGLLTSVYPVSNIDENPEYRFLMSPEEQIAAMRSMREKGETLAGIYHSHPEIGAVPSETDIALAAYPGVHYFIISLAKDQPDLRCYLLDGNKFREIHISVPSG